MAWCNPLVGGSVSKIRQTLPAPWKRTRSAEDAARLAPAINGHTNFGAAMALDNAQRDAAVFVAYCLAAGSVLGFLYGLVTLKGAGDG